MYEVQDVPFGSITVDVEAQNFRDLLDQVDMLINLGEDAEMIEDHVRFFYDDVEPRVVPRVSDDDQNNMYRGFRCLNTGVNITFKEDQNGNIYPGRYAAYENGQDNPKLYDPANDMETILSSVSRDVDYIRRHGIRLPGSGNSQGGGQPQQGQSQQGQPQQNGQSNSRQGGRSRSRGGGRGNSRQGNGGGNAPRSRGGGNSRGAPTR